MKGSTRTFAATLLIISATTVSAQESTQKELKASTPKVSGLINGRFGSDSNTEISSFDIRRLRLAVSGDLGSHIDYKVQAEGGGGSTTSSASLKIIDAFLRFKVVKEFNVQLGEFKVEYSQESLDGPAIWITIENPAAVNKLNGYNDESGLKANARDIGIRLYGGFGHKEGYDLVSYKVGLYNGNGINLKDNDKKKDFAGLLYVNPTKALTLTYGHYLGHYSSTSNGALTTIARNRQSAGLTYKQGNLFARSEYLRGKTGGTKHQGAYATLAYTLAHGIQPVLSYSYYQKDADKKKDNQSDYQIGINWKANKWIRTQVANTLTDYTNSTKKSKSLFEAQILASF